MSLAGTIQKAVGKAFTALDDLVGTLTYHVFASEGYNTATGTNTKTYTDTSIRGLLTSYNQTEIDGDLVRRDDYQLLINTDDISFTPSTKDQVTTGKGKMEVINVTLDPANAVYVLQLRMQ